MLAVCGGGGSDTAAAFVAALAVVAWGLVAALVIRTARDRRERAVLIALTLVSSLVGPAILFGLLAGFDGDNSRLLEVVVTLLLPGVIAAFAAVGLRAAHAARAFFLALWGAVLFVGAYAVLVISFFLVGTGCFS
ncbi:MAG TPA: hypothetical protein VFY48_03990 [Solirubrobacterales bacterium]|nr:hypothetical protein [Solirubrobacterales bacterium]